LRLFLASHSSTSKPGAASPCRIGADTSLLRRWRQNQQHAVGHLSCTCSRLGRRCHGARRHPASRVFSTFFVSRSRRSDREASRWLDVLESTAQAMFKVTGYVKWRSRRSACSRDRGDGRAARDSRILFTLGKPSSR